MEITEDSAGVVVETPPITESLLKPEAPTIRDISSLVSLKTEIFPKFRTINIVLVFNRQILYQ